MVFICAREYLVEFNLHEDVIFGRSVVDGNLSVKILKTTPFFISEIFRDNNLILLFVAR